MSVYDDFLFLKDFFESLNLTYNPLDKYNSSEEIEDMTLLDLLRGAKNLNDFKKIYLFCSLVRSLEVNESDEIVLGIYNELFKIR